jgi:hypothetical protein
MKVLKLQANNTEPDLASNTRKSSLTPNFSRIGKENMLQDKKGNRKKLRFKQISVHKISKQSY